jgi:heme/copper-type cytochrome/quinol oxidase subunit 3
MLGTVFALLFVTYFYLRNGASSWPTPDIPAQNLLLPTLALALLLLSVVPIHWASRAIQQGGLRKAGYGLALHLILAITFLVLRFIDFEQLGFTWYTSLYGSVIWIIMGFQTLLTFVGVLQTLILLGTVLAHRSGEEQGIGIQMDAMYWYFLALTWIPFYFLLYIYPAFLRGWA